MKKLDWRQESNNIYIELPVSENETKEILLDERIIKYLLAQTPRIFFIQFYTNGQKKEFLIDFKNLRPVISKKKKLKVTVKTQQTVTNRALQGGYFVIARGQSFAERFLSPSGWKMQEYHFPISEKTEQKQQTTEPQKQPEAVLQHKTQQKATPNSKQCPQCKADVPFDLDYCPHCFYSFINKEKDVDFAI